jgi:Zn-dependent membrane protease YugP
MFMYDWTFILLLPALAFAIWAQAKVRGTYQKYSQVRSRANVTGAQAARRILDSQGLADVKVEQVAGELTDHYDPRKRVLRLSEAVYGSPSLAALGIAAHEAGHALQHKFEYAPLKLRSGLVPVAQFGTWLAFPLFFIGFIIPSVNWMMDLGILFFAGAVAFSLVTLPVEYNASSRAIKVLSSGGYLAPDETDGARKVLSAAAWTYVAAATMAILQLLRLILLRGARD